jgi:cytochrome c-type biogenesis protein CcmH
VRQYFVDRYGEWILLEPRASGFNMLVYILPWLLVAAGIAVIVFAVRRWTRPLDSDSAATAPASTLTSRD